MASIITSRACLFYYIFFFVLLVACQGEKLVPPVTENYFEIKTSFMNESQLVVQLKVKEESEKEITLTYELLRQTTNSAVSIERVDLFNDILSVGIQKEFTLTLPQLKEGMYSIKLQALTDEDEHGNRWGSLREVGFTVKGGDFIMEYEVDVK